MNYRHRTICEDFRLQESYALKKFDLLNKILVKFASQFQAYFILSFFFVCLTSFVRNKVPCKFQTSYYLTNFVEKIFLKLTARPQPETIKSIHNPLFPEEKWGTCMS